MFSMLENCIKALWDNGVNDVNVLTARGVRFSPNFLCPGGQGFKLEKFSAVLKEKCRNSRSALRKLETA